MLDRRTTVDEQRVECVLYKADTALQFVPLVECIAPPNVSGRGARRLKT